MSGQSLRYSYEVVDAHTPVRIMALAEEPTAEDAGPAATSMLVFWEYVPAVEQPAPPGVTPVSIIYSHPVASRPRRVRDAGVLEGGVLLRQH